MHFHTIKEKFYFKWIVYIKKGDRATKTQKLLLTRSLVEAILHVSGWQRYNLIAQ